jgi:hypothetical protein
MNLRERNKVGHLLWQPDLTLENLPVGQLAYWAHEDIPGHVRVAIVKEMKYRLEDINHFFGIDQVVELGGCCHGQEAA